MKSSLAWNAVFWPNFLFIKIANYLAPNFTTEDFRIQVRVLLPIIPMAVRWHRLRIGPSDMYFTRKASFKDTLFIGIHQGDSHPVLQDHVSDCTFTRRKHPDCFPILHVRKMYLEGLFLMCLVSMLPIGCYVKRWNQYNFSIIHRLSTWGHRWILLLLLKFVDWYNHSNTNVVGIKCILNRFWCIIWTPKAILIKMPTLHNGLHNKFGLYVFPILIGFEFAIYRLFIVPNLKCIHTGFAMLWPF